MKTGISSPADSDLGEERSSIRKENGLKPPGLQVLLGGRGRLSREVVKGSTTATFGTYYC